MDTTPDRANKKRRKMQLQKRFKNGKEDEVDGKERVTSRQEQSTVTQKEATNQRELHRASKFSGVICGLFMLLGPSCEDNDALHFWPSPELGQAWSPAHSRITPN